MHKKEMTMKTTLENVGGWLLLIALGTIGAAIATLFTLLWAGCQAIRLTLTAAWTGVTLSYRAYLTWCDGPSNSKEIRRVEDTLARMDAILTEIEQTLDRLVVTPEPVVATEVTTVAPVVTAPVVKENKNRPLHLELADWLTEWKTPTVYDTPQGRCIYPTKAHGKVRTPRKQK
jgi:hypothetical protein